MLIPNRFLLSLLFGLFSIGATFAQSEKPDLTKLVDQVVDIRMKDGSLLAFATVQTATPGEAAGSIKNLKVKFPDSKRIKSIPVSRVVEIFKNDRPLDVSYDRKSRTLVHDVEKKLDRQELRRNIEEKLQVNGDRFWEPLSEEAHEAFMKTHRDFLNKVKSEMPRIGFRTVETKYFLFLTNLAPAEVDGYIVYLDAMYRELCKAFGLSDQKNIWCGKCVVVAFRDKADYLSFEANIMNSDGQGTQGLCHQYGDGRVIFAGYKGDNGFFGHVLVHETSHGFVHRYMTTARAPSWLNEGMADWLANVIVKGDRIPRRQQSSARWIIQNNGWGDFLTADRISGEHYGAASTMVEILLARSKKGNFKFFFDGIKQGKTADESLKDAFGLSYQDLKLLYAQIAKRLAK